MTAGACVALAMCAAAPAHACRVGGDQLLFIEAPAPEGLSDFQVVRIHFTNTGPDFEAMKGLATPGPFHSLIGLARLDDRAEDIQFPVFALVTSCTHEFAGKTPQEFDGEYYLVGQFGENENGRYFLAGGNWNGRWHK